MQLFPYCSQCGFVNSVIGCGELGDFLTPLAIVALLAVVMMMIRSFLREKQLGPSVQKLTLHLIWYSLSRPLMFGRKINGIENSLEPRHYVHYLAREYPQLGVWPVKISRCLERHLSFRFHLLGFFSIQKIRQWFPLISYMNVQYSSWNLTWSWPSKEQSVNRGLTSLLI